MLVSCISASPSLPEGGCRRWTRRGFPRTLSSRRLLSAYSSRRNATARLHRSKALRAPGPARLQQPFWGIREALTTSTAAASQNWDGPPKGPAYGFPQGAIHRTIGARDQRGTPARQIAPLRAEACL